MKKIVCFVCFLFLLAVPVPASASEVPAEFSALGDALPDEAAEKLPEGLLGGDLGEMSEAVGEVLSPRKLLGLLAEAVSGGLPDALELFAALTALFCLSSLVSGISGSFLSDAPHLSSGVSFAVRAAITVTALGMQSDRLAGVRIYFSLLRNISTALLPAMEIIYLAGGNGAAAAVNNASLIVWTDLLEVLVSGLLLPAAAVCMAFAAADSFLGEEIPGFAPAAGVLKKALGFVLGLGATLFAASLGTQTVIASAGDGVSAKTVKYMAGNLIPVVGSTVGDTFRTVAASARLLRATVGGAGIAVIAVILLPELTSLLLTRLALSAAAAIGEMLGCRGEGRLIRELDSLYGYLIAAAVVCSLMFVFALTVFSLTSSAAAGL